MIETDETATTRAGMEMEGRESEATTETGIAETLAMKGTGAMTDGNPSPKIRAGGAVEMKGRHLWIDGIEMLMGEMMPKVI